MNESRPLVVVPCDVKPIGLHPYHVVGEKYIEAVAHGADCTPVLLPALGSGRDLASMIDDVDFRDLLRNFDGVFLTGSASNVDPSHYQTERTFPDDQLDHQRDETTLDLIRTAVSEGIPLLAVCRGIQEVNVAYGGTLHQSVHSVGRFMDHRENRAQPRGQQYEPKHKVQLTNGGVLRGLHGGETVAVNSLHGQGIDRLGHGLTIEATVPDGLVEAVSIDAAHTFAVGVQWHPEWQHWHDKFSSAIFTTFGDAVRERAKQRRTG